MRLCQDVSDSDLHRHALHIARALGYSQFRASRQWIYSWKVRNGLVDPTSDVERLEVELESEESARLQEVAIALASVRPTRAGMEVMTQLLRGEDRQDPPQMGVSAAQRMMTMLHVVMAGLFGIHGAVIHLLHGLMSLTMGLMSSEGATHVPHSAASHDIKHCIPLEDEPFMLSNSLDGLVTEDLMERTFFKLLKNEGRGTGTDRLLETCL